MLHLGSEKFTVPPMHTLSMLSFYIALANDNELKVRGLLVVVIITSGGLLAPKASGTPVGLCLFQVHVANVTFPDRSHPFPFPHLPFVRRHSSCRFLSVKDFRFAAKDEDKISNRMRI